MTEQLPDDRAERAARAWFAQEASGGGTGSIDPAVVLAAAGRRQRLRFTGLLAAAAVLVAVLVIVPLALRPADPPITGIPASPTSEPAWTTTAPSPLSPRFGSLTAWLDGRFYTMGGWDGGPCPPGSLCDMPEPDLRDGAAYDPGSDTWTMIAEAPFPIGREFADGVAFEGGFYVQSSTGDGSFWVYRPESDQWRELAGPPADGRLTATSALLVLDTYDADVARYAYRPADDSWEPLPEGPIDSCDAWPSQAAGERLLVVGGCGTELRLSFYDPATREWSRADGIAGISVERDDYDGGGDVAHVAGRLLWPSALSVFSSTVTPGIYDIESRTWREVVTGAPPGGLSFKGMDTGRGPAVLDGPGLVEANGNLLDVRTATWVVVPQAPVPDRWDPVVAAGPESLLSCFGFRYAGDDHDSGGFAEGCYLLTTGPAGPPGPTVPPTHPTEPPSTGLEWRQISAPTFNPRSGSLLVAVNDVFYLMGGEGLETSGYRSNPDAFETTYSAWTPIADLPQVALSRPYSMLADVVRETIYVHFVFEELGELWAYDTVADRWRKIENTGEGDYFVGTEDGLVKVLSDEGSSRLLLLTDGDRQWEDLPELPVGHRLFRLGDHQLGYLTLDQRVAVLDTTTRSWQAPSEPGDVGSHEVYGVDGAAVFVYPPDSEGELMPNHKFGLNVVTLVDGTWRHIEPMLTDGGLGSQIGPVTGRWIVISGNLFDPHTQEWLSVPAIPGSDYQWASLTVAGGPQGVLSCFPIRDIDQDEPRAVGNCYFLTVP